MNAGTHHFGLNIAAAVLLLLPFAQKPLLAQQPWSPADPTQGQFQPQYDSGQPPGYAPQPQAQSYPGQPYADPAQQYPQQAPAQAMNTAQLEQLVAPIALYPDTLVAQILAAATYPAQIVDADHWLQAQGYASPDQIAAGADAQSWDPSVKALTAVPQILAELDQNIRWTIALGNAYYNQPQDVLDVVQVMRQRAQAAGNLQSTPQESVAYDQGYIQVAPVNPQVVYLPAYDPWTAYGAPIQPYRGFSLASALGSFFNSGSGSGSGFGSGLGSGAVRFGLGIAMSAFSHSSFGWLGWDLNWLTHALLFHNSNYYSHSTTVADWGLPRGGRRAYAQRADFAARQPNNGYRPQSGYNRPSGPAEGYGGYNRAPGQSYVRPAYGYTLPHPAENPYRGYPGSGTSYARPPLEARAEQQPVRPQAYSRPGYGYGNSFYGSSGGYAARPNPAFNQPQPAYRAPASNFQQRGDFGSRYSGSYGRDFEASGKQPKSSGHLFGGGHEFKEPKAPKPPKIHERKSEGRHSEGSHGGGHHR